MQIGNLARTLVWMNLRCTFTSPAQTDSAEWCAELTVIALDVLSICVVFEFSYCTYTCH